MKRKSLLIISVVLLCLGIIVFAKEFTSRYNVNNSEKKGNIASAVNSKKANSNSNEKKTDTKKVSPTTETNKTSEKTVNEGKNEETKTGSNSFKIIDEVSGRIILSVNGDYYDMDVLRATIKILDDNNKTRKVQNGYVSMIDGLKERDAGPVSGWCYYVNGAKLSIGAGQYTIKKGDKIEWKFLKDGINN